MIPRWQRFLLALVLGGLALLAAGCATTESDNHAERPWSAPRGWETGLPSSLNEGR
jgi:hypothetical protein